MKGERGEMGDMGSKGEQGVKGEKGCEGPMGLMGIAGARGSEGPAGPAGLPGPQGKTNRMIICFIKNPISYTISIISVLQEREDKLHEQVYIIISKLCYVSIQKEYICKLEILCL